MDLLGDIGNEDQLTAARSENAILQKRVKELAAQVKLLTFEKASLEAEVEIYRAERGGDLSPTKTNDNTAAVAPSIVEDPFFQSGNSVYCSQPDTILVDLHGNANPLCVAMNQEATLLATGGANGAVVLSQWGAASAVGAVPSRHQVQHDCQAPVISVAFHPHHQLVAAGSMDGTIRVIGYSTAAASAFTITHTCVAPLKHTKYCKVVAWYEPKSLLMSASADGDVHLFRVAVNEDRVITVEHEKSFHLGSSIETACFHTTKLYLYARETNFLTVVNLKKDNERSTFALHDSGGFSTHVSFAVLDMAVHGDYLACATDANRHVIFHIPSQRQVRNLYGHQADAYSSPVLAWSRNGQYVYCNTQHASTLCVYEVASGKLIQEYNEPHQRTIKAMWSSSSASDMLVTISYDRKAAIWFAPNL